MDNRIKLAEVIQENGEGEMLNSTFFTWKGTTFDINADVVNNGSCQLPHGRDLIPVDFDGDGITDFLVAPLPKTDNVWLLCKGSDFCNPQPLTLNPRITNTAALRDFFNYYNQQYNSPGDR